MTYAITQMMQTNLLCHNQCTRVPQRVPMMTAVYLLLQTVRGKPELNPIS